MFGTETPTTKPNNQSENDDVLDIAVTTDLPFLVYLTSYSALSTYHLPVLIHNAFRFSFHHTSDRLIFRRTDLPNFQTQLEDQIPFDLEFHSGMAIGIC
jgi:hypothetical protein